MASCRLVGNGAGECRQYDVSRKKMTEVFTCVLDGKEQGGIRYGISPVSSVCAGAGDVDMKKAG